MTPGFVVAALLIALLGGCGGGRDASTGTKLETGPLRIDPGRSAQLQQRGADNSLEEYGHEASEAELRQAASNVHAYLVAWVNKDWPLACSLGSMKLHQILKGVFESAEQPATKACAEMIAAIARSEAPIADTKYRATEVDAVSLRADGDYGYLLFYSGAEAHQQEVFRQGKAWKVKALLPSSLH